MAPSMPALYRRIHDALLRDGVVKTDSAAWAMATSEVARGCRYGKTGRVKLKGVTKAQYCAAYAQWKKSHPKGSGFGKNVKGRG